MPLEEAVLLIQRHERARQGRLRAKLMKDIRAQEEAEMNPLAVEKEKPDPRNAAILIQKASHLLPFSHIAYSNRFN